MNFLITVLATIIFVCAAIFALSVYIVHKIKFIDGEK